MPAEPPGQSGATLRPRASLEDLFLALEAPLLSYTLRLVKDPAMAEDVVQEAFLRLQAHEDEVREPRAWLYRTAQHLALNQLRAGKRLVAWAPRVTDGEPPTSEDAADPAPLPDEQLSRWEGIGLVRLGLDRLDERSRQVVELKFLENLSYRDIGARLGLTEGHVGYLLHHALKALEGELARHGLLR